VIQFFACINTTRKPNKKLFNFNLPVKLIPAKSDDRVITLPKSGPSLGIKLITPIYLIKFYVA
jgi:hypothetical protein